MSFNQGQRNSIWRKYYGNNNSAIDVFGRKMYKHDFAVDHIWPESERGKNAIKNGIPLSPLSNQEKADNYEGYINGRKFKVANSGTRGIGVLYVDGRRVSE